MSMSMLEGSRDHERQEAHDLLASVPQAYLTNPCRQLSRNNTCVAIESVSVGCDLAIHSEMFFNYHLLRGAVEYRREVTGLDCVDQPILKKGRIKVIRSCTTDRLCIRALSDEKTHG